MKRQAASNSRLAHLFLARAVPGLINLLGLLILTRALEPAQYGIYAVTMSSALLVSALSFHWLVQGVSRFSYAYRDERTRFLSNLGAGYGFAALAVVCAYPAVAAISGQSVRSAILIILIGCMIALLNGLFEILGALAVAELRNRAYSTLVVTKSVITAAAIFLMTRLEAVASSALLCVMAGLVAAILSQSAAVHAMLSPRRDREVMGRVVQQGVPLSIHYGLTLALAFTDRSIVAGLLGASATGFLAVTSDVAGQTLVMLMTVVYMSFFPLLLRAWESADDLSIKSRFQQGFRLLTVVGLPAATCGMLFAPNLAYLLMGEPFRETGEQLVPWVIAAALLSAFKVFYADLHFILAGKVLGLVPQSVAMLSVSVAAQFAVIPSMGLKGAVTVMVIVQALGLVMSCVRVRREFPLPIDIRVLCFSALVCVVFAALFWPWRNMVGIGAGFAQTCLLGLMFACAHVVTRRVTV
jgi:O-antigen/teichoic acid export membrane protein